MIIEIQRAKLIQSIGVECSLFNFTLSLHIYMIFFFVHRIILSVFFSLFKRVLFSSCSRLLLFASLNVSQYMYSHNVNTLDELRWNNFICEWCCILPRPQLWFNAVVVVVVVVIVHPLTYIQLCIYRLQFTIYDFIFHFDSFE